MLVPPQGPSSQRGAGSRRISVQAGKRRQEAGWVSPAWWPRCLGAATAALVLSTGLLT